MGLEIERKFLVMHDQWRFLAAGHLYCQGYVVDHPKTTVRVRIAENRGFLTLKGQVKQLARPEFEYEIPLEDAQEMLKLWCGDNIIKKKRYRIPLGPVIWEVDEFLGANQGLVIAEVELEYPDQAIAPPDWVGSEVTGDIRYYNSYLVKHPYRTWQEL